MMPMPRNKKAYSPIIRASEVKDNANTTVDKKRRNNDMASENL